MRDWISSLCLCSLTALLAGCAERRSVAEIDPPAAAGSEPTAPMEAVADDPDEAPRTDREENPPRESADEGDPELPEVKKDVAPPAPLPLPKLAIRGIPHIRQKPDFCGEACVAMWLRKLGHPHTQDDVYDLSGLDPVHGRGCFTREMVTTLRRIGFRTGSVWNYVPADNERALESQFARLVADLKSDWPTIVCMRYDEQPETTEHFRLIVGFDEKRDEVLYHEPAENQGAYRRMSRKTFLSLWPLKYEERRWLTVRMRMEPGRIIPPPKRGKGFRNAAYAQHILHVKRKFPSDDFHVVLQRPFVVIGDGSLSDVRRSAQGTVSWSVRRLKQKYFAKDPRDILDIWLFKDKESYDKHTKEIFDDEPTTPYGYYSHHHKALIMNIATGGGTLVHEIVHPFMAANFPRCPSWFNEGLASLYEQCHDRRGEIWGKTNWRLEGLHKAIEEERILPLKELCETSTDEFYGDETGIHYAEARYLCYYLQRMGKLGEFYRRFSKDSLSDPSGFKTLQAVLGEDDMDEFQERWVEFVKGLKYP